MEIGRDRGSEGRKDRQKAKRVSNRGGEIG